MKAKGIILFCVLSLFGSLAMADEASHRAAAEELLLLTNVDKMMKPLFEQMEMMMGQQFRQLGAPEELRPIFKKYTSKMLKIWEEMFRWEKIKDGYIEIYVRTFTENEIKAVSEFYKTPAGQNFVDKMPKLMQESMAISRRQMPEFMQKMQQLSLEMDNEIKKLKKESKRK